MKVLFGGYHKTANFSPKRWYNFHPGKKGRGKLETRDGLVCKDESGSRSPTQSIQACDSALERYFE